MLLRVPGALLITGVVGLTGRTARAESEMRQTIHEIKELMEPASHLEVRCDFSARATRNLDEARGGLDVEIATRPDYWYSLGVASIARRAPVTTIMGDGTVVTTTEAADQIGISARLLKRFGPLVLSGGIVDSTGGAGVELRGAGDRLRVEVLATNWTPSAPRASPRVRVGGSAQWRFFYLQAGVLDVMEDPRASAYLGIGLRWRDPDLLATVSWFRR